MEFISYIFNGRYPTNRKTLIKVFIYLQPTHIIPEQFLFTGHPTQWQNMTLAGMDGVAQGRVGKNSVSVLVDHF